MSNSLEDKEVEEEEVTGVEATGVEATGVENFRGSASIPATLFRMLQPSVSIA